MFFIQIMPNKDYIGLDKDSLVCMMCDMLFPLLTFLNLSPLNSNTILNKMFAV